MVYSLCHEAADPEVSFPGLTGGERMLQYKLLYHNTGIYASIIQACIHVYTNRVGFAIYTYLSTIRPISHGVTDGGGVCVYMITLFLMALLWLGLERWEMGEVELPRPTCYIYKQTPNQMDSSIISQG